MPHNLSEPEADRQLDEGAEFECALCGEPVADARDMQNGICRECHDAEAHEAERAQALQETLIDLRENR